MSCDWLACGDMATQSSLGQVPARGDLRVGPPGLDIVRPRSASQDHIVFASSTSRSFRGSA
eukprot:7344045-Alexandrium_andersonii.AAC.1